MPGRYTAVLSSLPPDCVRVCYALRTLLERMNDTLKSWAESLKGNIYILYLVAKDARVAWQAKVVIALVVAYALNPIDFQFQISFLLLAFSTI